MLSSQTEIEIRGAREHNLQNVSLKLPKNELIVMTGVSGSGKSSLAFDTLYAEGQRRYVESLSTYARQFLGQMSKPDVDSITGIAPCISIQQKTAGRNPRSTVGTMTEIYDYLRVLFARIGQGYCYVSGKAIQAQPPDRIVESILKLPAGTRFSILAPIVQNQKGEFKELFQDLLKKGFLRARVDGEIYQLTEPPTLQRHYKHNIEVVIDRLVAGNGIRNRLSEAVNLAIGLTEGLLIVVREESGSADERGPHPGPLPGGEGDEEEEGEKRVVRGANPTEKLYSTKYACPESGMSYEPPSPQLFSFNSPLGMCLDCNGLGIRHEFNLDELIDGTLSIDQGAFKLVGNVKEMGRWRKHIYKGIAEAIEQDVKLKAGTFLSTPWNKLPEPAKQLFLYGLGERLITYSWVRGRVKWKHGGTYAGVIKELLDQYRETSNPMRRKQYENLMRMGKCTSCEGARLNKQARYVRIKTANTDFIKSHKTSELNLPQVCELTIAEAMDFFAGLELDESGLLIAGELLKEIRGRLGFLLRCGLDYLSLERQAPTLSGGESQRIRLAGQIGCGLVGVIYVLDEPSIGLHPRDNVRLLQSLCDLRDQGNTVIVVEHDEDTMRAADHIVDFGPGPGHRGGRIVAEGSVENVMAAKESVTGQFLSRQEVIAIPAKRREASKKELVVRGATHHNLKNIDVSFPLERLICVTGVSGSGKSSLVNDILWQVLHKELNKGEGIAGTHKIIEGLDQLDKAIDIDQSPIGRTPRSNPATYTKLFDLIRDLFTQMPASKLRGFKSGRFSFNVKGGRCEKCEGNGASKLEMDFLADVWVPCPVCNGQRFNQETLEIKFKNYNISQVLDLEVRDALEIFENVPKIKNLLQTLHDVGLDYLKLGQPSPTLSGGEAQRIKLARELGKRSTGKTVYLLDEPTTGLHFVDVRKLIEVMHNFVEQGNTVIVVEHHLDVIKTADYVIDMGLEGGAGGGRVIVAGTPEEVAGHPESYTGHALAQLPEMRERLAATTKVKKTKGSKTKADAALKNAPLQSSLARKTDVSAIAPLVNDGHGRWQTVDDAMAGRAKTHITIRGAKQHNLQDVNVDLPRDQMLVFCGPSGSGKSSLAMDTLYAEGQRRYVESLSSYARQFLGQMPKPQVEQIRGLSPAIAIEQKTVGSTPRSTIGTVTEIYDYLRVLYARLGILHCPKCESPVEQVTPDQIVERILSYGEKAKLMLTAPILARKGEKLGDLWKRLQSEGFNRVRVDGEIYTLDKPPSMTRKTKVNIEIVVDRISVSEAERSRLTDSVELALGLGNGVMHVVQPKDGVKETHWLTQRFSRLYSCDKCGESYEHLTPQNFSFNHPLGWCPACEGLGAEQGGSMSQTVKNPQLSLAEGAIIGLPDLNTNPLFAEMLGAVLEKQNADINLNTPLDEMNYPTLQLLLFGDRLQRKYQLKKYPNVAFEWHGLYPTLQKVSRVSYAYRQQLSAFLGDQTCGTCSGSRLRTDAGHVKLKGKTMQQLCQLSLEEARAFLKSFKLDAREKKIAGELLVEVLGRLDFLLEVGLDYLTLDRTMPTLSGGESQRIRLAGQLGRSLTGVLYVLDEPTIGLHPRDNNRLIGSLKKLRDLGNTVVLVEHDREVIEAADGVYDFGPGSGRFGGNITAQGTLPQLEENTNSLTGAYLKGTKGITLPSDRRIDRLLKNETPGEAPIKKTTSKKSKLSKDTQPANYTFSKYPEHDKGWLKLTGAHQHNLQNVDLQIPLGTMTCITGVSGSGKSSLIMETLAPAVRYSLREVSDLEKNYEELTGYNRIHKLVIVDQQPLGNTPASNPATFTGVWEWIREFYAGLPEARVRGFSSSRFSTNRSGGRCEDCEGVGQKCVEMHFLPDVWVECTTCRGKRFNHETLQVKYKEKTISDVLEMSISEALELFTGFSKIVGVLGILCEMGLGYLKLGQSAPTLSGGEAQRIKLAAELAKPQTGKTLYLLDEPTTGLHFDDIVKLLKVINGLIDKGNTAVIIEHNLDVIKSADWVIDLGPEAGAGGGYIVAEGTPEDIVEYAQGKPPLRSYTGEMLTSVLAASKTEKRQSLDMKQYLKDGNPHEELRQLTKDVKAPWEADGRKWHTVDRRSHTGKTCRWDGEILSWFLDEMSEYDVLAEPNFNHRSIVEVKHVTKQGSWFLHALTGDEWILTLNFRVPKRTMTPKKLEALFELKPLDQINEIPRYSGETRTRLENQRGPLQEISLKFYKQDEVTRAQVKQFLSAIIPSFDHYVEGMRD